VTATALPELVARFRNGERRALARMLTLVENERPQGLEGMAQLYRDTGSAHVLGITGPPGAGKSTLTNALIRAYRAAGQRIGVLAVDPSSALTGGATLGDRIRMLENYADDGVYIRSMATRGQLGGLSIAVGAATHILDAYGFDIICIETVGVGQDEVDIGEVADTVLLLQVPGQGDSIQTIKAGILEIADILVVNKSDAPGAGELVRDLRNMLRLGERGAWATPIVETTAIQHLGLEKLLGQIARHREYLAESGAGLSRREQRLRGEVLRLARRQLSLKLDAVMSNPEFTETLAALLRRERDPLRVANELTERAASGV
jgi:LAO/AO transport system kinase